MSKIFTQEDICKILNRIQRYDVGDCMGEGHMYPEYNGRYIPADEIAESFGIRCEPKFAEEENSYEQLAQRIIKLAGLTGPVDVEFAIATLCDNYGIPTQ